VPGILLRPAEPADGGLSARIQLEAWTATYGLIAPAMTDAFDLARTG
jgi:hypothetical protein